MNNHMQTLGGAAQVAKRGPTGRSQSLTEKVGHEEIGDSWKGQHPGSRAPLKIRVIAKLRHGRVVPKEAC